MAKKEQLKVLREKVLADCNPEFAFWLCNGTILRNVYELATALDGLDEVSFTYHVNKEKNDFANWIGDVLGDSTLAKRLKRIKNQKKYVEAVRKRIEELEKA